MATTETIIRLPGQALSPKALPVHDLVWAHVSEVDGIQTVEIWRRNQIVASVELWETPAQ